MKTYLNFLVIGLILGLFTEVELKLVASINPGSFPITLVAYPIILTIAFLASRGFDRLMGESFRSDIAHYLFAGIMGITIEWTLLGNGPGSNAIQIGMFAMWTTFCFGPRVLTRQTEVVRRLRRKFWFTFTAVAILLTATIVFAANPQAKIVISVIGLSASYVAWSVWMLIISWKSIAKETQSQISTI